MGCGLRDSSKFAFDCFRQGDANEVFAWEEVVFTRFIDDTDQPMLIAEVVIENSIQLSKFERRGVLVVLYADREVPAPLAA